jgi:hypothetical protein
LNFNPVVRYTGEARHLIPAGNDIDIKNSTLFNVAIPRGSNNSYQEL